MEGAPLGSPVVQWWPGSEAYSKKSFSQLGQHWQPPTKSLTMNGISEPSQLKKPWLLHLLWSKRHSNSFFWKFPIPKASTSGHWNGTTINNAGRWNGDSVRPWLPIAHLPPCIKLRGTTTTMQNKRIMSNGCHMWFMYIHVHSNQPARRTANCKGFAGAADWLFGLCSLGKHKLRTRRAKYKYLIQGKHGPVIENCAVYFRPGSLLLRWDEGFWALNWCKRSQVWDMFFPSGFSAKVQ